MARVSLSTWPPCFPYLHSYSHTAQLMESMATSERDGCETLIGGAELPYLQEKDGTGKSRVSTPTSPQEGSLCATNEDYEENEPFLKRSK